MTSGRSLRLLPADRTKLTYASPANTPPTVLGAFRKARGLFEEALELAGRLENHASRASVMNSLAIVYDQLGDRQRTASVWTAPPATS